MVGNSLKTCAKCNKTKPKSEFHKESRKASGVMSRCKDCRALDNDTTSRSKIKRRENWNKIFEHFGGRKCSVCGIESEYPIYDLHHTDPTQKDISVARIAHHSWEKVKTEVEKCVLLCANCHRIEHAKERE